MYPSGTGPYILLLYTRDRSIDHELNMRILPSFFLYFSCHLIFVSPVWYMFDSELCCIYMFRELFCCACNVLFFSMFNKTIFILHIQQVENLRDQLLKERSLRASLESGLMNMRRGQVSFPSTIDTKVSFLNLAIEVDNVFHHFKFFSLRW
jgi:hypothetical protein